MAQRHLANSSPPPRTLGLAGVVGVAFFCVCGGAYGLEDAVQAAGPRLTLIAILVAPWVWSLPMALMTAELSAALPEDGGYVVWVERACGRFWGFQEGWWSWLCNTADNALYPVLFASYLKYWFPQMTRAESWLIGVAMIAVFAALNIRGTRAVGICSAAFTLLVLAPFVVMVALGAAHLQPTAWAAASPGPVAWSALVSVVLWNFSGWDNVGCCAGEVVDPARTYPRGLVATVLIVVAVYLSALAVGVSVSPNREAWRTGYFPEVGRLIGGPALGVALMAGGVLSAMGLFNALLLTSSRVPLAMATRGWLPGILAQRHARYGTPWVSILANALGCALLVGWAQQSEEGHGPFVALAEINMLLYAAALVLEYFALVRLRQREPNLPRPYRVPGGTLGVALLSVPPLMLCGASMALCPRATQALGAGGVALGFILYAAKFRRPTVTE